MSLLTDIYKSLESNFIYEEGCFTSVEEMKHILGSDMGIEIRNVEILEKCLEINMMEKTQGKKCIL